VIRKAFVNGEEIPREAIQHEFERLVRLYSEGGMPADEIKRNVEKLLDQAQEQAIGAKLVLLRAGELGLTPDELVARTCAGTPDPGEAEMEEFYRANRESFGGAGFVQVQTKIREFLRHAARGKVLAAFIAELREKARIEYRDRQPDAG
jgi:hypothetical protein